MDTIPTVQADSIPYFVRYAKSLQGKANTKSKILLVNCSNYNNPIDTSGIIISGLISNGKTKKVIKGATVTVQPFFKNEKPVISISEARKLQSTYPSITTKSNINGEYMIGGPYNSLLRFKVQANGYTTFEDTLHGGFLQGYVYTINVGLAQK